MATGDTTRTVGLGMWTYNKGNYSFDTSIRWARFTTGRAFALKQVGMFRDDVSDLTSVTQSKGLMYAPIMGMVGGFVVTVLVEGRSGLKFPAPPTFISGIYLQCLSIGFCFMILGLWLVFHSAFRANVAAVQLRTRKIRLPVPTQRQLDAHRRLASDYEMQNGWDVLRVPFAMPNLADSPMPSEDEKQIGEVSEDRGSKKGGYKAPRKKAVRMPGRPGVPLWVYHDYKNRKTHPRAGPSGGKMGSSSVLPEDEPLEHFEYVRQAQKEYWACEVYMRICMLYGMMHLIQAFAYWLVIHCIAELAMVWCANVVGASLTACVYTMWYIDVLPDRGGGFPIEASGPLVAAMAMSLFYSASPTSGTITAAWTLVFVCFTMQILWTFRMYIVACPAWSSPADAKTRESGGRKGNESASCEHPLWLPSAYQHVQYLIAPPKPKKSGGSDEEDPMKHVDMRGWKMVRVLLITSILAWFVLVAGAIQEATMGERTLVSNPGAPPWTRLHQWEGWEWGPITSKHYAHVTPMRGHFFWDKGFGPNGKQELWPSDLFGFHAEADYHWRRLRGDQVGQDVVKTLIPAAVRWPAVLEPDHVACSPALKGGSVVVLTDNGVGAMVSAATASGRAAGVAEPFELSGISNGPLSGASWGAEGLLVVAGEGAVLSCPQALVNGTEWPCRRLNVPMLPSGSRPASVTDPGDDAPLRAAVALGGEAVALLELKADAGALNWHTLAVVAALSDAEEPLVSLSLSPGLLLATTSDGAVHQWQLQDGLPASGVLREVPAEAPASNRGRAWQGSCQMPDAKLVRLAARWQRDGRGDLNWRSELLF